MKLTKDKLFERQKELNFYNLMGVMNTSMLLYETSFSLNAHYFNFYVKDKEKAMKWCHKAAQLFMDKLHFGQIEWTNESYGSRWVEVELARVLTRIEFYSKKLDGYDDDKKYMLVFEPTYPSH